MKLPSGAPPTVTFVTKPEAMNPLPEIVMMSAAAPLSADRLAIVGASTSTVAETGNVPALVVTVPLIVAWPAPTVVSTNGMVMIAGSSASTTRSTVTVAAAGFDDVRATAVTSAARSLMFPY